QTETEGKDTAQPAKLKSQLLATRAVQQDRKRLPSSCNCFANKRVDRRDHARDVRKMASGAVCAPKCNPWYYRRRQGFGNRTEAREVVGWLEKNGLERITSAQPQAGRSETNRIGGPPEFRSNDGYARQYRYRSARSGLRRVD